MLTAGRLRVAIVGLGAAHVLGLVLGRTLLPWSGALTLAALLAYAWMVSVRTPALVGLAALTAAAALVDGRGGWPMALAAPAADRWWGAVEAALSLCAAVGLTLGVVRALGRPRSRVALAVVVAAVTLVAALALLPLIHLYADRPPWRAAPNPLDLVTGPLPPMVAAVGLALAAGLAWTARRRQRVAAAAMSALAMSALVTVGLVVGDARFHRSLPSDGRWPAELIVEWPGPAPEVVVATAPRLATSSARVAAPVGSDVEDEPELWPGDFWAAPVSPYGVLPLLGATLCLVGLVAMVTVAQPPPEDQLRYS